MKLAMTTGLLFAAAMPAFAQDAENGERQFARQCVACHVIVNDDGDTLAGRNARTGPNLYDMVARGIAGEADFNYGDSLVELREQGAEAGLVLRQVGQAEGPADTLRFRLATADYFA